MTHQNRNDKIKTNKIVFTKEKRMPPKPKTQAEIEHERDKILNAALEIIEKSGFDAMSMRAIARKCGVTTSKIYYYFINKNHIYMSIMERSYGLLRDNTLQAYAAGNDEKERFINCCDAVLQFGVEYPDYFDSLHRRNTPRTLDFEDNDGPLKEIAIREKEVGVGWFELFEKSVVEYAAKNGKEYNRYDVFLVYSPIHGAITLNHSRNLPEVEVDFDTLCEKIKQSLIEKIENKN